MVGTLSALPASPAVAIAKPDLRIASVAKAKVTVQAGGSFSARAVTSNRGSGAAARSHTRFYLTRNPKASGKARRSSQTDPRSAPADVLLGGERAVRRLAAGARQQGGKLSLRVGPSTAPGTYRLLACADDRAAVREVREHDNCTAARGTVTVAAAADPLGPLQSFGDQLSVVPDAEIQRRIEPMRALTCTPVPVRRVPTAKAALRSIRASLTAQVGAAAIAAFNSSKEASTADAARGAALSQLTSGNLGAALIAQTRAAELAPRDRSALTNTAALAVSAGLPNEAVALLGAAVRTPAGETVPGGANPAAVAAQIEAMARLQLGQGAKASALLASVALLDPQLEPEAASGEASQALCASGAPAAVKKLRRAAKRGGDVPALPFAEEGGHGATLRGIEYPATPHHAAARRDYWGPGRHAERMAEIGALGEAEDAIELRQRDRTVSRAQRRREQALWARIYKVHERPHLKAIQQAYGDAGEDATEISNAFFNAPDGTDSRWYELATAASDACAGAIPSEPCRVQRMRETCTPEVRVAHNRILSAFSRAEDHAKAYLDSYSRIITGLGRNFDDPDSRELVRLVVARNELTFAGQLQSGALTAWNTHVYRTYEDCVVPASGEVPSGNETAGSSGAAQVDPISGPCNAVTKQLNISLDLGKMIGFKAPLPKLKVNCERVQLAYEFGPSSWVQPFAQVDWKYRAGSVSVFAGVRGKLEFSGRDDQLKGGIYLTASKNGVEDAGWRTSVSSSTKIGIVEIQAKQDFDLSFVPAFEGVGSLVATGL